MGIYCSNMFWNELFYCRYCHEKTENFFDFRKIGSLDISEIMRPNKKITVLIVDDERVELRLLFEQFRGSGFKVLVAENGQRVFKIFERVIPDIILLDVMLPDTDGFEICRRLKKNPDVKDIPVIFMTALTDPIDKLRGFEVGGADYITKPFDCGEVLARIQLHLNLCKLRLELQHERDRFRALAQATSEGILIHDLGIIAEANPAAESITGYSREELMGRNISELFAKEFRNTIAETNGNQPCEVRGIRKGGNVSVLEIRTGTVRYQDQSLKMLAIHDITRKKFLEQENLTLRISLSHSERFGEMTGKSAVMKKVYEHLARAAASDETVVICGETGTGKELAARTLFQMSANYTKAFVAVNCAAVLDSLFESQFFGYCKGAFTGAACDMPGFLDQSQGGVLFLDEIVELKPEMQAKLLRVLQDRDYRPVGGAVSRVADVRIIAASNKDLRKMVHEGKMREDFFHRLNVITVEIPPLRSRKEDIPLLIEHFLTINGSRVNIIPVIPDEIISRFYEYDWPGNVRELFNVLRRFIATGEADIGDYPTRASSEISGITPVQDHLPLSRAVDEFERRYIARVISRCHGQKKQAADILGVDRKTLYNKLNKYEKK